MACCLIAAFLMAQFVAMLKRWGMFWGLVAVPQDEEMDTVFTKLAAFARKPYVRPAFGALLLIEAIAGGGWLYLEHGTHVAQLADIGWSRLQGKHVVYARLCSPSGDRVQRVVLPDA